MSDDKERTEEEGTCRDSNERDIRSDTDREGGSDQDRGEGAAETLEQAGDSTTKSDR